MNINATLLIQAAHFGIVYGVLRVLVLKPAYALIMQERAAFASLDTAIQDEERTLALLQEEQSKVWHDAHRFFIHTAPHEHVHEHASHIRTPTSLVAPLSDNELQQEVRNVQDTLIARLKESV